MFDTISHRLGRLARVTPALVALSTTALVAAGAPPAPATGGDQVVAEFQGQKITRRELEDSMAGGLADLDRQRQKLLEDGLNMILGDRLIQIEAKARGIDPQTLVQTEVAGKVSGVSDDEVGMFYAQNRSKFGGRPKEVVAGQIKQYLGQQQLAQAQQAYLEALKKKYGVRIGLEPLRYSPSTADSPTRGPESAPVTIVEFSDFQCPFCSRLIPILDEMRHDFGDKIRLVFRQYPLKEIHPLATKAAEAALCAKEQGKFWEMHDALYANQQKLAVEDLKATAAALGLDAPAFAICLDEGRMSAAVASSVFEGRRLGLNSTPSLFVNGRLLAGLPPKEDLVKLIEEELARRSGSPSGGQ
ncbi:MAG: thioredoxin domain-containing protein [Thermoanaerobaculia bacterium]